MQPASLQSLSVCGLTVSVILFAAEGLLSGMPMFMLVTVWISTLVAGTGIYFLFTVVFVVFDNWCCYPPGSSFDDFTLGRCTVRTSQIIHTVGKWHKCNSHDFTRGEIIGIGVICGAFVIWLVLFVIRIILFKASLYRLCVLRRLAGRLRNKHAVTAYNAAVRESRRLRSLPDFRTRSHPALLYRFRYILAGDPASILFGYCAVAANMKAWHVLLQVMMSMVMLACVISYLVVHKTVWMWWILVIFGGLSAAVVLVHHMYMAGVMFVFVHTALNDVVDAFDAAPPKHEKDSLKKLLQVHHDSSQKAIVEAHVFTKRTPTHDAPWRPTLGAKLQAKSKPEDVFTRLAKRLGVYREVG